MGETTPSGPIKIFVECDEPGCYVEGVVWSGDPTKTEPIYTTPAGWYFNDEPRVVWCPEHRKRGH
jgi:hypothetical protein